MLRFLTITALVAAATASHMLAKKIHKDMLVMNSMTACWGKGNMLAFKVGMKKAMETCMNENHSGLLKPANPLLALPLVPPIEQAPIATPESLQTSHFSSVFLEVAL